MDNEELRAQEREALEAIFGGEEKTLKVGEDFFEFLESVNISEGLIVEVEGKITKLGFLIKAALFHFHIRFILPQDYPTSPPVCESVAPEWLPKAYIEFLQNEIHETCQIHSGEPLIFPIWQLLKEVSFEKWCSNEKERIVLPAVVDSYLDEIQLEIHQIPFPLREVTCNICFSEFLGKDMILLYNCDHYFCRECLRELCMVHIKEGTVRQLVCPETFCQEILHSNEVFQLVPREMYDRYDELMFVHAINSMEDVVFCPKKGCNTPIVVPKGTRYATCGVCNNQFCTKCFGVYHGFGRCPLYLSDLEKERESRKYFETVGRHCPKCEMVIEKNGGCDHMYCTRCNTHFNWSTSRPYTSFRSSGSAPVLIEGFQYPPPPNDCDAILDQPEPEMRGQKVLRPPRPKPLFNNAPEALQNVSKPCPRCKLRRPKLNSNTDTIYCLNCQCGFCFFCGQALEGGHFMGGLCKKRK